MLDALQTKHALQTKQDSGRSQPGFNLEPSRIQSGSTQVSGFRQDSGGIETGFIENSNRIHAGFRQGSSKIKSAFRQVQTGFMQDSHRNQT